jgi:copper chaperone CopZ
MTKTLRIEGMSCSHCVAAVTSGLEGIPGVGQVAVSLERKNAVVEISGAVADGAFRNAVEEAGFELVSVE